MQRSETIQVEGTDVTRQKIANLEAIPRETVGELIQRMLKNLSLPQNDSSGNPLLYRCRLEREGRQMQSTEIVGEALQENDRICLQPEIVAA